ncbi:MAG: M15 family metallopeptidase [Pyrinomonadaceae bacterium]|nr:M15 family metallopeptidase [Pyrinomonadaceae bacterium]
MRVLRKEMTGEDVERWQFFLVGQNHQLEVDGNFGDDTVKATKAFQAENHLDVDGAVGSNTLGRAMTLGFNPLDDPGGGPTSAANFPPPPAFRPLVSTADRQRLFGAFQFAAAPVPSNPENIRILGGWEQDNIIRVAIPQLVGVPGSSHDGGVRFHKKAVNQLLGLWKAWGDAGLLDRLVTWDGSFVPRFVRGSRTVLSNHAFGTAFDINAQQNARGARPALVGRKGCVRELVGIAHQHGFYWGGHFGNKPDGMHFEIAVIKQ